MIIAIDFDGTCVTHAYPAIGGDIGAVPVLQSLVAHGHKLILHTMRNDQHLEEAVQWFEVNEIALYGINVNPTQYEWTSSPKPYAQLYIDDAALGVPLTFPENPTLMRPFVDWKAVEEMLKTMGVLPQ